MSDTTNEELRVLGATLQGFAQACVNLNIVAGSNAEHMLRDIEMGAWYPFERLRDVERLVISSYENSGPILERVGIEMMTGWYHHGPGKQIIDRGVGFLHFQTGSEGYHSVVRGPEEEVGGFDLVEIDEQRGRAVIRSTDPFNKDLERGVIIGGMSAPGDLAYVDVTNDDDRQVFQIEFH
jgi:hypothetical protein